VKISGRVAELDSKAPIGSSEIAARDTDNSRIILGIRSGSVSESEGFSLKLADWDEAEIGAKLLDVENVIEWNHPRLIRVEQLFPYQPAGARVRYGVLWVVKKLSDLAISELRRIKDSTVLPLNLVVNTVDHFCRSVPFLPGTRQIA
jgi:hypothetical protein